MVFTVTMLGLLVASTFLPASAQLSQWRSLNPTRDGTSTVLQVPYLYSVQILNPNYGWAVGGTCGIYTGNPSCDSTNRGLALFWDGSKWRQTLIPANAGTLASVFIVAANNVWAVGTNATIIHWDGTSWVTATVPASVVTDNSKIFSVFMLPGGMDGWAVGSTYAVGAAIILRWSGAWPTGAWSVVAPPAGALDLHAVAFSSATQGWAVGITGTILRWDGLGWTLTASPTTSDLFSVSIVSAMDAWVVGASSTIIHWNGASWTGPMVAPTITINYRSIHMVSAADGWIAGDQNTATTEGLLLRWDGITWSIVRSYVTVNLNDVFLMPSGTLGASVGDAETIIYWNGSSWLAQTSPTFTDINAVYLSSSNDGWGVGDNGTIFRWNGQSWNHYETLPSRMSLNGLFMTTSTDAWAVGNATSSSTSPTILRWNGVAWSVVTPPGVAIGQNLTDVFMLSATEGWAVGTGTSLASAATLKWDGTLWTSVPSGTPANSSLRSVHMLSSSDGWAVGSNATIGGASGGKGPIIVRWNGLAWSLVTTPLGIGGLRSVHFLTPSNGWAVGNNGTDRHATIIHWDGSQWTRVPAPLGNLTSVYMASANDGWAVGQNETAPLSLIVHWDGITWDVVSTVAVPPSMSVALRSVFMVESLNGWIVGDRGLILHYGPEVIPGTTTSTSTVVVTSTSTSTTTSTTSTTSTSATSTTAPSTWGVPGFPIESILAGLLGGLIALTIIRRRRRL